MDIDFIFDIENFPVLQTERLVLRELSLWDMDEIKEMNDDEDILKYIHYGVRHSAYNAFEYLIKLSAYKEAITWGIALRESNELIGIRSCFIDSANEPVTIQGQLRKAYRNQGYTSEAYEEIINFLAQVGVKSIKANADKSNTAAIALLNKMGFQAVHQWPGFSFNDPNPNAIIFTRDIKIKVFNKIPSTDLATPYSAVKSYIKNEDFTEANVLIDKLIASSRNDFELAEATLLQAILIRATKGNVAAIPTFHKCIKLDSNLSDAYVELGISQYVLSDREVAHKNWRIAADLGNQRATTLIADNPEVKRFF